MPGYQCIVAEDCTEDVAQLFTSLRNGSTVGACDTHLPILLVGALAQQLGVDPDRLQDALRRFETRERDRQAKADQAAAEAAERAREVAAQADDDESADDRADIDSFRDQDQREAADV